MTINGNKYNVSSAEAKDENSPNFILRIIQNHYNVPKVEKSAAQIRREKNLVPGLPFNRWFCIPAAILIQFCCGSLYTWSVFNKPIDRLMYGEVTNTAPITFYIAVGFLGLAAAFMGPILERRGPMLSCFIGATIFFTGNLLTALALYTKQMWLVFLGYGVICGFGIGVCYISPVSALQKWFPDKRGMAAGFATCGFGAGSIAIAKAQIPLMDSVGLPLTFVILGSCFYVIMMISALVLRTPPPGYFEAKIPDAGIIMQDATAANGNGTTSKPAINGNANTLKSENNGTKPDQDAISVDIKNGGCGCGFYCCSLPDNVPKEYTLIEALTSRDFRAMIIMFSFNIIFGLVLISRFSNIITDVFGKTPDEASTMVSINGGFNLIGRLVLAFMSDLLGRKNIFILMLSIQVILLGCFSLMTNSGSYWVFLVSMWVLTACYGGGFGVIPAFLSDKFGAKNTGACHGIILTGWSFAGIGGGLIFTAVFDALVKSGYSAKEPYPYNMNVWWIFGLVCIGWISLLFVAPMEKDLLCRRRRRSQ